MKKKLIAILATVTMLFAFAGCGSNQEAATGETTAPVEETTTEATTAAPTDDSGIDKAKEIGL